MNIYTDSPVNPTMFNLCINLESLTHLDANTPDTVVIEEESKEVFLLEVACTFDPKLEEAFMTKVI